MTQEYRQVIDFWFKETTPKLWFSKDDDFDALIRERFSELHRSARMGELYDWRGDAEGRLAEIIVLDQFSRNLFRNLPGAFESDAMALALAQEAVANGADMKVEVGCRRFFYLPYMHSESLFIHDIAMELFSQSGLEENLHYEQLHKNIIARFGRYPHRNAILGRKSSQEELEFLKQPGSSF